jgi:hypothetical protein
LLCLTLEALILLPAQTEANLPGQAVDPKTKACCDRFQKQTPNGIQADVDTVDYKFTHLADVEVAGKLRTFTHAVKNNQPSVILPLGWEEAGMPYVRDNGRCRSVTNQTRELWHDLILGEIIYGTKKQGQKKVQTYVMTDKPPAGQDAGQPKDDKKENAPAKKEAEKPKGDRGKEARGQEQAAGNRLRARIYASRTAYAPEIDLHLVSWVDSKKGEFHYEVSNVTANPILFKMPELTTAWNKIRQAKRETIFRSTWNKAEAAEAFLVRGAEGKKPGMESFVAVVPAPAQFGERVMQLTIVSPGGEEVVAGGKVVLYMPRD